MVKKLKRIKRLDLMAMIISNLVRMADKNEIINNLPACRSKKITNEVI